MRISPQPFIQCKIPEKDRSSKHIKAQQKQNTFMCLWSQSLACPRLTCERVSSLNLNCHLVALTWPPTFYVMMLLYWGVLFQHHLKNKLFSCLWCHIKSCLLGARSKLRTSSCMPGKHSANQMHPQPLEE